MTSAAIYARVSSDRQKKDETIGSQTAELREHAARNRLDVPEEWIFQDEAHSGETLLRPALEARVVPARPAAGGPVGAGGAEQVVAGCRTSLRPVLQVVHRRRSGQLRHKTPKVATRVRLSATACPAGQVTVPCRSSTVKSSTVNPPLTGACSGLGLITA